MQFLLLTFVCAVWWCVGGDGAWILDGAPSNRGGGHWWRVVVGARWWSVEW